MEKKVYLVITDDCVGDWQIEAVFEELNMAISYLEHCIEAANQVIRQEREFEDEFEKLELTDYDINRNVLQAWGNNRRTSEIIEWVCNKPKNEVLRNYKSFED